jgi:predicted  nucleic acid-binding Zn-ribbon protein
MNRKDVLNKRLLRLDAKKKQLEERVKVSTDAAEVRAMTEQLDEVNAEIAETRDELTVIEAEERASDVPAYGERLEGEARNGAIVASFAAQKPEARDTENVLESMEYREAFRELWTQEAMLTLL